MGQAGVWLARKVVSAATVAGGSGGVGVCMRARAREGPADVWRRASNGEGMRTAVMGPAGVPQKDMSASTALTQAAGLFALLHAAICPTTTRHPRVPTSPTRGRLFAGAQTTQHRPGQEKEHSHAEAPSVPSEWSPIEAERRAKNTESVEHRSETHIGRPQLCRSSAVSAPRCPTQAASQRPQNSSKQQIREYVVWPKDGGGSGCAGVNCLSCPACASAWCPRPCASSPAFSTNTP